MTTMTRTAVILPSAACWTSSGAETGPNSVPPTLKYHSVAIDFPRSCDGTGFV